MNVADVRFDIIAKQYEPIIKKQIKSLNIYKNYDDFYQQGLIGLWEAYERFDPEKGSFATFAIASVRGKMLSLLAKETRYEEHHQFAIEDENQDMIDEKTVRRSEPGWLDAYTASLSDRQRLWVEEAILLEKTTKEIATSYDVSINTVSTWRKQALKKLRTHYRGQTPKKGQKKPITVN
ncbi:sigma-70 family RNA polymerase sigma factor [Desertibacillus haloalkaliphilus]|uniref:sigma-70 family RNA polymerase sigma factor n=1 Tax=Desertibacillus haloalkaliphilus TaxID=1328930 RepID=UPI001C254B6C|nr:sigma-70 family RNA polymerase sigma factor [Desertibacillus haloalkaliphilus]MBU8905942.1 sigma-70 family RNA polymerase sigma factor [Desertibacillus haloalkaliphilus]